MGLVLCAGSVSADIVVRAATMPNVPGLTLASDLMRAPGGKAGNVAVMARRLGCDAVLWGCVGDDDLGELAVSGPRDAGVDVSHVRRATRPTGTALVTVLPDGDKSIVLTLGANDNWPGHADSIASEIEQAARDAAPDGVLVVDVESPPAIVAAALASAKRAGIRTILDPSPADRVTDEMLAAADHVTPDHLEAGQLVGIDVSSVEAAQRAGLELIDRGAGTAHVKLGGGGCVVMSHELSAVIDAARVRPVDTTGAGDAFAAGLAWTLLDGCDSVEATRFAVAAATYAVGIYGAQAAAPAREDLAPLLGRIT